MFCVVWDYSNSELKGKKETEILTEKNWSKFTLIIGKLSIENTQAVIIFGFELQIVPHYANLSYHLQYALGESKMKIFRFISFPRVTFFNSPRTVFNEKWTLLSWDTNCSHERQATHSWADRWSDCCKHVEYHSSQGQTLSR